MMFTAQMTQLFAVVLAKDKDRVTETLLREGVMQFIHASEYDATTSSSLNPLEPPVSKGDVADLRKRIEGFLHTIGIVPATPQETDLSQRKAVDLKKEEQLLDKIEGERGSIRERQRVLQQEILRLEDIQRQVNLYGIGLDNVNLPNKDSILSIQTGKLQAAKSEQLAAELKGMPALNIDLGLEGDESHHLLITMKRDRDKIDRILEGLQWHQVEVTPEMLSMKKDLAGELATKIEGLNDEQKKLQEQVDGLVGQEADHLQELWVDLRLEELCQRVQDHFQSSSHTVLFAGWLPAKKKASLQKAIAEASENRCYLEWTEAGSEEMIGNEIPVKFRNPRALAPFQMLVSNFGIPKYGTIDPTPFVMPLYLAMFGLMFADVGQGLVLAILGALGVKSMKGRSGKEGLLHLAWLIIWCGCSSMVFGALFGSYFGYSWVKPLWFDFHGIVAGHSAADAAVNNVYDILLITIYFGIAVIGMGLVFNWVNLARMKQWLTLVFDKGGLLGGWMYAGGIYSAAYMVAHGYKEFPADGTLFMLLGLPALLLLLKEPLHLWQHGHDGGEKANIPMLCMNILMEWIVELLEIFSGYLSNTLSFMRVAGLGIAHVCLMISFASLAGMTDSLVMKGVILVLGNMLVIGLEGLSAGIQALRLNYYEFFTKFFHGTGKPHSPIALNSNLQG
ncbi:MAG: V-type ATPase 116kDa subunit family protein [Verrucomicrobiota bacterium]